jgi:hypothetical protein
MLPNVTQSFVSKKHLPIPRLKQPFDFEAIRLASKKPQQIGKLIAPILLRLDV